MKKSAKENMAENNFNLNTKLKILENGGSEVFSNWEKYGLITKEEFTSALTWLCHDPLDEKHRLTRAIGLYVTPDMEEKVLKETNPKFYTGHDENKLKGHIVKLKYSHNDNLGATYICDFETGRLWDGNGRRKISINALSRI